MGKILICVIIPAVICIWGVSIVLRKWYLKIYPKTVEDIVEIREAAEKYDEKLSK